MTPTPTQIATQAAEAIFMPRSRSLHPDPDTAHELRIEECAALILAAAAKMVQQSGAVAALELTEKLSPGMKSTREAAVAAMTALDRLRSISEGEAK